MALFIPNFVTFDVVFQVTSDERKLYTKF